MAKRVPAMPDLRLGFEQSAFPSAMAGVRTRIKIQKSVDGSLNDARMCRLRVENPENRAIQDFLTGSPVPAVVLRGEIVVSTRLGMFQR